MSLPLRLTKEETQAALDVLAAIDFYCYDEGQTQKEGHSSEFHDFATTLTLGDKDMMAMFTCNPGAGMMPNAVDVIEMAFKDKNFADEYRDDISGFAVACGLDPLDENEFDEAKDILHLIDSSYDRLKHFLGKAIDPDTLDMFLDDVRCGNYPDINWEDLRNLSTTCPFFDFENQGEKHFARLHVSEYPETGNLRVGADVYYPYEHRWASLDDFTYPVDEKMEDCRTVVNLSAYNSGNLALRLYQCGLIERPITAMPDYSCPAGENESLNMDGVSCMYTTAKFDIDTLSKYDPVGVKEYALSHDLAGASFSLADRQEATKNQVSKDMAGCREAPVKEASGQEDPNL